MGNVILHHILKDYLSEDTYHKLIENSIIIAFIQNEYHSTLLLSVLKCQNEYDKQLLDQAFKAFYAEIRLIKYISSLIYFSSLDYDRKNRKRKNRYILSLDQPLSSEESDRSSMKNLIAEEYMDKPSLTLEQLDVDQKLFKAIHKLTSKEKSVLTLAYLHDLTDKEIAHRLNLSQQAINKMKNNALRKLRNTAM